MVTPREYVEALNEVSAADAEIKRLVCELKSFTDRLSAFPEATCFVEVEEDEPPLGQLISGAQWHASDFPTPERIQAALRQRLNTRSRAKKLWDSMHPQHARGLSPVPLK